MTTSLVKDNVNVFDVTMVIFCTVMFLISARTPI